MEWLVVLLFITIGLVCVVLELVLIPGTTVVGILGFVLCITGVVLSFTYFGSEVGWTVFAGTFVLTGVMLYLAFRKGSWNVFALKTTINSKITQEEIGTLTPGLEGVTTSTLRPMGNAEFRGRIFEVTTLGNYLASGTRIRIAQVSTNQIIVEPIA
jgi:membrane-bound ClpP family serine protease